MLSVWPLNRERWSGGAAKDNGPGRYQWRGGVECADLNDRIRHRGEDDLCE